MSYKRSIKILKPLCLFIATVRHKTISAASEELGIPGPRFSEAIRELEFYWQVPLLRRKGRNLTPTKVGLAIYQKYAHIYDPLLKNIQYDSRRLNSHSKDITVTAPVELSKTILADTIFSYKQKYPKSVVKLLCHDSELPVEEHCIDLSIRLAPVADTRMDNVKIFSQTQEFLVATPAIVKQAIRQKSIPLITFTPVPQIEKAKMSNGAELILEKYCEVDNSDVLIQFLLKGLAAAYLPLDYIHEYIVSKRLEILELSTPISSPVLHATWHDNFLQAHISEFLDILEQTISTRR